MNENILIVDDDTSICEILEFNLKSEGYTVELAYSAEEALEKFEQKYTAHFVGHHDAGECPAIKCWNK